MKTLVNKHPFSTDSTATQKTTNLDLHIKHRVRVHRQSQCRLHMMRQSLLVALLDRRPFFTERFILYKRQQILQLLEVLEPHALVDFEGLGNEGGELGVALDERKAKLVMKKRIRRLAVNSPDLAIYVVLLQ